MRQLWGGMKSGGGSSIPLLTYGRISGLPVRRRLPACPTAVVLLLVVTSLLCAAPAEIGNASSTALLDAAQANDHVAAMDLLGTKGVNVNATTADGATAIMYAAANNDLELVRALIKAGANVKPENQLGSSAITEAAIIGSAPVLEALLKAGADPNFKTPNGETPIMAVARTGRVDALKSCWTPAPTSTPRKPGAVNPRSCGPPRLARPTW
jgi:ankyrin repeat protein